MRLRAAVRGIGDPARSTLRPAETMTEAMCKAEVWHRASGRSMVCQRLDDHVSYNESLEGNPARALQAMPDDYRPGKPSGIVIGSFKRTSNRLPVVPRRSPPRSEMGEEDVVYWARMDSPTVFRLEGTEAVMEGARRNDDRTSRSPYRSSRASEATSENADPGPVRR